MPEFIPGIELSRRYYEETVRPILWTHFPDLLYAAAHLGPGSDVLGFDTAMSTDHDWGPSVHIFLSETDAGRALEVHETLSVALPDTFCDYPVDSHRLFVTTARAFFWERLAYDIDTLLDVADWLTFPAQRLLEVTSGAVHEDKTGELTALRDRFRYYPHDVWLYLMAAQWQRIGQEEHLALRAGYVGDELGSAIISSRLVRDVMNLCFLMERKYAPYAKWFGTAFARLHTGHGLSPILQRIQSANTWTSREEYLCEAYTHVAKMHNGLGVTEHMPTQVSRFYTRPFQVIHAGRFAEALLSKITDEEVRSIASRPFIGGIDQFSDNTDMREQHVSPLDAKASWRHILKKLYTESP